MQHAGLQYGQGAAASHQPPFADVSQTGGSTSSSLRQFRKKEGLEKNAGTDLNIENSHIARVPPHNHYPARPNEFYRYQHQYPDYNTPYKDPPAQVKYSEIAETTPQAPLQHVDHLPLQKHKDPHKDFMDMCNLTQPMKQTYPQQTFPPENHHQVYHKPESQYQQYPKYNMPSQCRKYPHPPENDFLAKLQRINPTMARSIMSDHHIREAQTTYPTMEQNRMYQNQRYYPTHLQNNLSYNYSAYNYPSSCNYKHPDYGRTNQMPVGGAQYPALNAHSDRSISPRNLHMMNYGSSPQKISPNYSQYNPPEYAQHYQHRRTSIPQEYYQQTCRTAPYNMAGPQISPEPNDNRGAGSGLRHFIENWAEEEGPSEITPIFKENIRIQHNNDSTNEQVFVINPSDIPPCLENVALVPTENGQFIIKNGTLENSVVRIKETTENNGERTVNLQIVEAPPKGDCMLADKATPTEEVPYQENQKNCDETTESSQEESQKISEEKEESHEESDESPPETSVIVSNEVSVIKDMPLIEEEQAKNEEKEEKLEKSAEGKLEENAEEEKNTSLDDCPDSKDEKELFEKSHVTTTTKRAQRIFSVDDIMNNIGNSPTQIRRSSLQFPPNGGEEKEEVEEENTTEAPSEEDEAQVEEQDEEMSYSVSAISVEENSVILEIGGALVQLNINHYNGTKVLSVVPLSESLVIDVNGNYQPGEESKEEISEENKESKIDVCEEHKAEMSGEYRDGKNEENQESVSKEIRDTKSEENQECVSEESLQNEDLMEDIISSSVCQSEVVIGEENVENELVLDFKNVEEDRIEEIKKAEEVSKKREERKRSREGERKSSSSKKIREDRSEERPKVKKIAKVEEVETNKSGKKSKNEDVTEKKEVKKKIDVAEDLKKRVVEEEVVKWKKKVEEIPHEEKARMKKLLTEEEKKKKHERKMSKQNSVDEAELGKEEEISKVKKSEKKSVAEVNLSSEEEKKKHEKKSVSKTEVENLRKKKEEVVQVCEDTCKEEKEATTQITIDNKILEKSTKTKDLINCIIEEENLKPKKPEEKKGIEKPVTKAAKKLYVSDTLEMKKALKESENGEKPKIDVKKSMSKLEETVNKLKSLKQKSSKEEKDKVKKATVIEEPEKKVVKKVTFSLEPDEVRQISKEEMDRRKLSWEEYNSRKRKLSINESGEGKNSKIMEDTVTSSDDINDEVVEQVALSIEKAIEHSTLKKSPQIIAPSNWEDDTPSPETPTRTEVNSTTNRRCIIDANEFNIKPIECSSTPSPVSSSQFSYHSEDDSLQVYKDVVDSKLNSLNIRIPKFSKPKPVDKFSVLLDRFLNKGSLNVEELEEVKKFIELKRKMMEEKKLTYEVRGERERDLKLHFKKVPEKRQKKRFRNLYTEDSSDDSDSSRSEKGVGDYSVYQRDSTGVPKLIFKRKSGLPQPFVKLERSQAVELLAKKRKLY